MPCSSKILVPIGLVFGSDLSIGGISEVLRSCCHVFRTTTQVVFMVAVTISFTMSKSECWLTARPLRHNREGSDGRHKDN